MVGQYSLTRVRGTSDDPAESIIENQPLPFVETWTWLGMQTNVGEHVARKKIDARFADAMNIMIKLERSPLPVGMKQRIVGTMAAARAVHGYFVDLLPTPLCDKWRVQLKK
eukprot:4665746-Amphidinium_carterae.1